MLFYIEMVVSHQTCPTTIQTVSLETIPPNPGLLPKHWVGVGILNSDCPHVCPEGIKSQRPMLMRDCASTVSSCSFTWFILHYLTTYTLDPQLYCLSRRTPANIDPLQNLVA